jgi:hypothetical protein
MPMTVAVTMPMTVANTDIHVTMATSVIFDVTVPHSVIISAMMPLPVPVALFLVVFLGHQLE